MVIEMLNGCTSQETAHITEDYPYSFRLRCQRREWLEYKKGHGYRMVTQTSNPKRPSTWNAPKASTYSSVSAALYLDENGHVQWAGVSGYEDMKQLEAFAQTYAIEGEPKKHLETFIKLKLAYEGRKAGEVPAYEAPHALVA